MAKKQFKHKKKIKSYGQYKREYFEAASYAKKHGRQPEAAMLSRTQYETMIGQYASTKELIKRQVVSLSDKQMERLTGEGMRLLKTSGLYDKYQLGRKGDISTSLSLAISEYYDRLKMTEGTKEASHIMSMTFYGSE